MLHNYHHVRFFIRAAALLNAEHAGHLFALIAGRDTAAPHSFVVNFFVTVTVNEKIRGNVFVQASTQNVLSRATPRSGQSSVYIVTGIKFRVPGHWKRKVAFKLRAVSRSLTSLRPGASECRMASGHVLRSGLVGSGQVRDIARARPGPGPGA